MTTSPSFPRRILLAAAAVCAFCTGVSAATVDERPAYYVEWLGASGTQNLDTEYVFKTDPRVETTMMLLSNADKDVAGMPAANASCFIIDYKDSAKTIYYRYHASGSTAISYPDSILNQWADVVWGSEVRQNGMLLKTFATQNFSDNTASFHLFYARTGMNGLRFQRVRMYDGGTLVRDLHPAVMANGTPCMYDSVTDKCYLNTGTGTFSVGDRVTSSLTVEASPYAVGAVTPPYGFHEKEMTFGLATNCTAPATVAADGFSAICAGYRFYRWSPDDDDWALESSGAGNTFSFTPDLNDAKIVWLWNVAADLALSVDGAPSSGANSITFPVVVHGLGSSPSPAVVKAVWGYAAGRPRLHEHPLHRLRTRSGVRHAHPSPARDGLLRQAHPRIAGHGRRQRGDRRRLRRDGAVERHPADSGALADLLHLGGQELGEGHLGRAGGDGLA